MQKFAGGASCRSRGLAAVTLVLLIAAGCGKDKADTVAVREDTTTSSTSTTSTTIATTTTTLTPEQVVLRDYAAYWAAVEEVSKAPNPDNPLLAAHATSSYLDAVKAGMIGLRSASRTLLPEPGKPFIESHPKVTSLQGATAKIRDCWIDNTVQHDAKTGAPAEAAAPHTFLGLMSLVSEGGSWKIARGDVKESTCAP